MYNRKRGFQDTFGDRRGNRDARRELPSRTYLTRIPYGPRSLFFRVGSPRHELGFCFRESFGGFRRYGYRYLGVWLESRFLVRLSRSLSAQSQRSRGPLALVYKRAIGGRSAQTDVGLARGYEWRSVLQGGASESSLR